MNRHESYEFGWRSAEAKTVALLRAQPQVALTPELSSEIVADVQRAAPPDIAMDRVVLGAEDACHFIARQIAEEIELAADDVRAQATRAVLARIGAAKPLASATET